MSKEQAPKGPAGWQLVPVEPTPEMLEAELGLRHWDDKPSYESRRDLRPHIWRAMLAAAPKAVSAAPSEPVTWNFPTFADWWNAHGRYNAAERLSNTQGLMQLSWEVARERVHPPSVPAADVQGALSRLWPAIEKQMSSYRVTADMAFAVREDMNTIRAALQSAPNGEKPE